MDIRRMLQRAAHMCPAAYFVQKLSLIWACILLLGALILMEGALPLSPLTYHAHRLGAELVRSASAVLLIGVIGAVCIEERFL